MPVGPVFHEPRECSIQPRQRDAGPALKAGELLRIAKDAIRNRLVSLDPSGSLVGFSNLDKLVDGEHATSYAVLLPLRQRFTYRSPARHAVR